MADKWFDYSTYMSNKRAQLNAADSSANWTADQVAEAFENAGFHGVDGAQLHFETYGHTAEENLSPNANFIPSQYYIFKAASYFEKAVADVTDEEAAFIRAAIKEAGMSAWDHYTNYGTAEGINPSNNFDTNKYLEAKLEALKTQDPEKYGEWTTKNVADAFKEAGLNALEHAMQYSGEADEPEKAFNEDGSVADAYKVDDKASGSETGSTLALTREVDNLTGTSGDDTFSGDQDTASGADNLDGAAGTDTLKLYNVNTNSNLPTIKSIENVYLNACTNGADVSKYADVKMLTVDNNTAGQTYTLAKDQSLTLENMATNGGTHTIAGNTPTELAVTVDGVTRDAAGNPAPTLAFTGTALTTVNLTATNAASMFTLTNAGNKLATVNVLGDAKVDVTEALTALTTVNAAENSAGVTWTATGEKNLTFTGGAGDDTLAFAALRFNAQDKVDMGEGKDTVGLAETSALTAANYAAINGVQNAEVLGVNGSGMSVDAAQITNGIKSFNIGRDAATATITNMAAGADVTINNNNGHTTITLGATTGTAADVTLSNTTQAAHTITTLDVTGIPTVKLTTSGTAATTITTLASDGSSIVIGGEQNLTVENALGNTARAIDASGMAGALSVTGGNLSDTITGGSGNDTLGGGTLTAGANAGANTAQVSRIAFATDATAAGNVTLTINGIDVTVAVANGAAVNTIATDAAAAINANANVRGLLTADASASGGNVNLTFNDAQAYTITVAMGTVGGTTGTSTDTTPFATGTPATAGSIDTLKGGDGADTFVVANDVNVSGGQTTTAFTVISDFENGKDHIAMTNGDAVQITNSNTTFANVTDLATAAAAAMANATAQVWTGTVGSNTYLVVSDAGLAANQYGNIIQLTGVAVADIDSSDFVAA